MQPNSTSVAKPNLALVDHPVMIVRDGTVEWVNTRALTALGPDVVGKSILDLVPNSQRVGVNERLESRSITPPWRVHLMTVDGWRAVDSSWIPNGEELDSATVVMWREVTRDERVQAWLSAVTDSSAELIGLTDASGRLLYMNDALLRLRGEDSRDTLPDGRNAMDHAAPGQSEIIRHLLGQLATVGRWRGQIMFQGAEGIVPVDAVIERNVVGADVVYSLIGRDASEELELRTGLVQAMEERERFVAQVAHEIKNPLSAVEGMALVLREETDLTADQREMVDLMIAGASDINRVIADLTGFGAGVPAAEYIATEDVDLLPLARTVIDSIEAAGGARISLTGSASCIGDELRIRQVLRNLLINAIRYGGPDIRVELSERNGRAQIDVSDDGEGVAEEHVDVIFDVFSTAHGTVEDSMGVGLAVSRRLTVGMGGSLTYSRRSNRTHFTVDLCAV